MAVVQPVMQAYGLYDLVRQRIFDKWSEADAFLQDVLRDYRTKRISAASGKHEFGISTSEPAFKSAVLATYRYIRAKLDYQRHDKRPEFREVVTWINNVEERKQLDEFMLKPDVKNDFGSDDLSMFIRLHLLNGEFLELDGVTRFEFEDNRQKIINEALSLTRRKDEVNKK